MLEDRWVNINGSFAAWKDATVHMMSHGFSRGSTIFEVISFHDTRRGVAVFRLEDHIRRLFRSAALLDMELPVSQKDVCQAVAATIGKNGLRGGFVKVLGYYPQVAFEILPPQRRLDLAVFALDSRADLGGFDSAHQEGTTVGIAGWRKLDPQTVPIEAKAAANYLNGMIARAEVRRRGFKDVLMLDTQGFLAEGGTEAYFFVRDGKLLSPALGTVLAGITRRSVIEAAAFMGVETVEGRFRRELVAEAEEIFISSTPFKVLPVRQIEERVMADVPGPVTKKFSDMMQRIVGGEVERFKDWLYPVR